MTTRIKELRCGVFEIAHDILEDPDSVLKHVLETEPNPDSSVMMYGKRVPIPRDQYACGDKGLSYSFAGTRVPARPWTPVLATVRDELEKKIGIQFNFVLVNIYQDGTKYIGYHRDDEKDLDPEAPIAGLSLGATRDFAIMLDAPACQDHTVVNIPLPHNSLIIMGKGSQKNYKHAVPKRLKVREARVSLTFRRVIN